MLTVIIIAKNEEINIRRCLQSVQFADEIVVLDSGSSDNTVNIAKEYTNKVFETDWQGFGIQKQRALEHATSTWVLNLDADEYVSENLRQEILKAIKSLKYDAYKVPIQMCFYQKPLRFSASPKRHVRLFKRIGAKFSNDIVHEKIVLPNDFRISKIKNPILHNSFRDLSHALYKTNLYSSYSAKIRIDSKQTPSISLSLVASIWMFLRCYILQGGFMDGKAGLVFAIVSAEGSWYRGLKQIYKDRDLLT